MASSADSRRLPGMFLDWLAAGRSYAEFRQNYPEFSERDIGAALHSLPTPVVFPRRPTPYVTVGAHALVERLAALYGVFKDPLSPYRLVAERALVDEWAAELFWYCRQKPLTGLRFLAMLTDAEKWTALILTKDGIHVSIDVTIRLGDWRRFAMRLPPSGFIDLS